MGIPGTVYSNEDLAIVVDDGKVIGYLNHTLIIANSVPRANLPLLRLSHVLRYVLAEEMRKTNDPDRIVRLGRIWTNTLFFQQSLWNFDQDEDYHNWEEIPHCCCRGRPIERPVLNERTRLINPNCPVHSWRIKTP